MVADIPERSLIPPEHPPDFPVCPVCGSRVAEDFYFRDGRCLGCERCVRRRYYLDVGHLG